MSEYIVNAQHKVINDIRYDKGNNYKFEGHVSNSFPVLCVVGGHLFNNHHFHVMYRMVWQIQSDVSRILWFCWMMVLWEDSD